MKGLILAAFLATILSLSIAYRIGYAAGRADMINQVRYLVVESR